MNRDFYHLRNERFFIEEFQKAWKDSNGYRYYLPAFGPYNPKPPQPKVYRQEPVNDEDYQKTPDIPTPDLKEEAGISEDDGSGDRVFFPEYRNLYQLRNSNLPIPVPIILQVGKMYPVRPKPKRNFYTMIEGGNESIINRLNNCIRMVKGRLSSYTGVYDFWIGDGRFTGWYDYMYYWEKTNEGWILKKFYLEAYKHVARDMLFLKNALNDIKNASVDRMNEIMQLLMRIEGYFYRKQ